MNRNISSANLRPLDQKAATKISLWEYPPPYQAYSFGKDSHDWLFDQSVWGIKEFYLESAGEIIGQVSCQPDGENLWVSWSMHPTLCGNGYGSQFVDQCVTELCRVYHNTKTVLLQVVSSNQRAIRAYRKAGFTIREIIHDISPYSGKNEEFYIMAMQPNAI